MTMTETETTAPYPAWMHSLKVECQSSARQVVTTTFLITTMTTFRLLAKNGDKTTKVTEA